MLFGSILQNLLELRSLVGFEVGNTPLGFLQLLRVKKWLGRLEVYIQCVFETWQGVVGQRLVKSEGTWLSIVGHRCQYLILTYFLWAQELSVDVDIAVDIVGCVKKVARPLFWGNWGKELPVQLM